MGEPSESAGVARAALLQAVVSFAGDRPARDLATLRTRLDALLSEAGEAAVERLMARVLDASDAFSYFAPEPLAREIHRLVADVTLGRESLLEGTPHLETVRRAPLVIVANHLSYSDANLLEVLLVRAGFHDVASRLTVVAGPKVYSDPMRRFASLCFGTIKTPQSSSLSSAEAVMSPREVARIARDTIALAVERVRGGDALLVFAEGTRSRTGAMQETLAGVTRYLEVDEAAVLPIGITGSERLFPVGVEKITPTPVRIRVGRAAPTRRLLDAAEGNRRLTMDAVGVAIARLLPEEYRGVYAEGAPELAAARAVADAVFG